MTDELAPPTYTYDETADAVYLYLAGPVGFGELARSQLVPWGRAGLGASITLCLDHSGAPRGLEFLGVSKMFTAEAIEGFREGRTPFDEL